MRTAEQKRSRSQITKEITRAKRLAAREIAKVETQLKETLGAVERYVRQHPRQAAAITLSLGAALGAAGALFFKRSRR